MTRPRTAARLAGHPTYEGGACALCGGTERRVKTGLCVTCKRKPGLVETPRTAARRAGETTYHGTPCTHGHDGLRYVTGGKCYHCEIERSHARAPLTPEQRAHRQAIRPRYREAEKAHKMAYKPIEVARRQARKDSAAPTVGVRDAARDARKALALLAERIGVNATRREAATRRLKREMITQEMKRIMAREKKEERKRRDPVGYREYARNKRLVRRARERENGGSCSPEQLYAILVEQGYTCAYCDATEPLERDHKVSVNDGGSGDCHNMQWLCRDCNNAKGDIPDELYRALFL